MKISTHECFFLLTFQSGQILREASLLSERSNGRELLLLNKQRTDPGSQPPSASKAMGPHREPTEMVERERTPNSVYSYHSVGYGKVCSLWFLTVAKKTVYSPFVYRHFLRLLECLKSKFYSEKRSSVRVFAHIVVNPCLFIALRHSLSQLYSVASFLTY